MKNTNVRDDLSSSGVDAGSTRSIIVVFFVGLRTVRLVAVIGCRWAFFVYTRDKLSISVTLVNRADAYRPRKAQSWRGTRIQNADRFVRHYVVERLTNYLAREKRC
jgi:hypothetical protein